MTKFSPIDNPAQEALIQQVQVWLDEVVIGLNLCPFASKPRKENRVRFYLSLAQVEEELLSELQTEMQLLDKTPAQEIETTLVLIPNFLADFFYYQQFLNWAQAMIMREGWQGVYQFASFHPDYYFAGTEPEDAENLTNRSPLPIIHIIRESSLAKAIEFYGDVDAIPERNKIRMEDLAPEEKRKLFPYLFKS